MGCFNDKIVCNKRYTRDEAIPKLMEYYWVERDAILKSLQTLRDTSTEYVSFTVATNGDHVIMKGRKNEEEQCRQTSLAFDEQQ